MAKVLGYKGGMQEDGWKERIFLANTGRIISQCHQCHSHCWQKIETIETELRHFNISGGESEKVSHCLTIWTTEATCCEKVLGGHVVSLLAVKSDQVGTLVPPDRIGR